MKRILGLGLIFALGGCAEIPFTSGPPPATAPATPVFFQPFSAALDAPSQAAIASAALAAGQQPHARVYVTGAADSVGSAKANKYLSETRAQVVTDALVSDGVARGRIHIRAAGTVPAPAPAGSPAQSARRVLIQIGG